MIPGRPYSAILITGSQLPFVNGGQTEAFGVWVGSYFVDEGIGSITSGITIHFIDAVETRPVLGVIILS